MTRIPMTAARVAVAIVCTLAAIPARAMPPGADGERLREAAVAIEELRIEEASAILDALASGHPADPDVRFERAIVRFFRGDYEGATGDASASVALALGLRSGEERFFLYHLIWATREVNRDFVEQRSPDGRYVVRHAPGPDRVVADYAIDVMRAADLAMQRELGIRVPGPIRVEIYPSAATLSEVSSLSVEAIERTGTIALCKWDRLMITSPRALVRGYPWADTVAHELVHLALARASRDRAPVWMQEGFARFLERSWRGGAPSVRLDPASASLLGRAVREGHLLPFERLHPSIALLPTAEDAALAFAQVSTFVQHLHRERGSEGLRAVVARVAGGADAREAFAAAAGSDWEALETAWREELRAEVEVGDHDAEDLPRLQFRHGEQAPDDTEEVEIAAARRALRLGDLLWSRGRPRAAAEEYARAWEVAAGDPIVGSRLARASLEGGRPERAVEVLTPLTEQIPDHQPLWSVLGSALLATERLELARAASLEAIRLNPFDPQPHCDLAAIAGRAAESAAESARESRWCRELRFETTWAPPAATAAPSAPSRSDLLE